MENIQHAASNTERRMAPSVGRWIFNVPKVLLLRIIRLYQLTFPPARLFLFGPAAGCRFTPSCSQYAMEAVRVHGIMHGSRLAVSRVCRCHPLGNAGHDPVPPKAAGMCCHG